MVAFGVGEEAADADGAAAFAGDDEGQVFAAVAVAVFQAGAPHHEAVVQKGAVAFAVPHSETCVASVSLTWILLTVDSGIQHTPKTYHD